MCLFCSSLPLRTCVSSRVLTSVSSSVGNLLAASVSEPTHNDLPCACRLMAKSGFYKNPTLTPKSPGLQSDIRPLSVCVSVSPEGFFRLHPDGRRKSAPMAGRRSAAVVVPCPPPSAAPPPRTANPTPPRQNSPHGDFERRRRSRSASPCDEPPAPGGGVEVRETAPRPAAASSHPGCRLPAEPNGSEAPPPAASSSSSSISHGSLSDFSRPPSSRFSRSTDLASGRSSVLSGGKTAELDPPPRRLCALLKAAA